MITADLIGSAIVLLALLSAAEAALGVTDKESSKMSGLVSPSASLCRDGEE